MINLDTIANELFNKIRGRFPSVTVGNENAEITNTVKDARFFEFDFVPGKKVSINLDSNSLTIMYSKSLFSEDEDVLKTKWFDFLKEVRAFAKKRMLNFDTRDITKNNLDKRDYEYLSTEKQMSESKLYGTSRTSFQNIGTARMVVKHSAPVNQESATGRNSNIAGIYIESSQGERFKYPFKHLNGARAMAQHVSEGGTPFDDFGKHVTGLSEELNKLRKFKTYMNRSSVMAEGLSGYMDVVNDRLVTVKKTIENIQKPAKYKEMSENFTSPVLEDVPEDIASDWTAQLTIKQFNEELKGVFPYIYNLVSEANKVQTLGPNDLLGESHYPHEYNFQELYGIDDIALYKEMADDAQDMEMHEFHDTYSSVIDMADEFWEDHQDEENDDDADEGIENEEVEGESYHCKDCGDTMHNPTTDCPHDSHDENGDHWVDDNGNGIHDADEGIDPEVSFETHLDNIIKSAKHEQEPEMTAEEQAFEDFKMAAANAAAKGEKDFEYPKGSGKKHPVKMDKGTAAKLLADSQTNEDERTDEALPLLGLLVPAAVTALRFLGPRLLPGAAKGAKEIVKFAVKNPVKTTVGTAIASDPETAVDIATGAVDTVKGVSGLAGQASDTLSIIQQNVGQAGQKVLDTADELKTMAAGALDNVPNLNNIARIAGQYALPAAVVMALLFGGYKAYKALFGDDKKQMAGTDSDAEIDKKDNVPLEEFVKSMYDYTNNSFPKGETAVMTAVQKKYGDQSVGEAQEVMVELLKGQDEEMARIQHLAGLR